MSKVLSQRIRSGYEPIKGYVLEKRLGRGGYGEVWRAEAPGGLKKAVKFVFGQHDERRAEQERKSLERIKGVNHPFILTLERFELIENQLVIVTELADGSLDDVYKQHRSRGSCGIPRETLIGYMRDAADALDYLHQLYKLQHLDIKPANLLMVGGRVKVADFGLLKDLGDVDCSVVGGLTPIYAPPEVFDGRPSMSSDQYSLAVMYQELLTGARPFGGRTIAQLATQHVHNAPNLEPLPPYDRPTVARALEKSPERRYRSCAEFVNKLASPHGAPTSQQQGALELSAAEAGWPNGHVNSLPRLVAGSTDDSDLRQTQTLVIALGGTGAQCLKEIRGRIEELGAASPLTLHSVLIDTDPRSIQAMAALDISGHAKETRLVETPLRSPQEYRRRGTDHLHSVSRRWIYNVPRHARTGGMRPLGRLALVDHGPQVTRSLTAAVAELAASLNANNRPRVYLVGSLTGGTGSGIFVDVAHLLRHLLDSASLESVPILSLLTTGRLQADPSRPLALHATHAALLELAHFLKPENGYPGDAGAGWPAVPAARTPLRDAYVVAQSDQAGSPVALDSVVNYLWSDATCGHSWFDKGRQHSANDPDAIGCIRTLCVVPIGDPTDRRCALLAPHLVKSLLYSWLGNPSEARPQAMDFVQRIVRRCHLTPSELNKASNQWIGGTPRSRRQRLQEHLRSIPAQRQANLTDFEQDLSIWHAQTIGVERAETAAGQTVQKISHEISLRLQDGRLNLSSALTGLGELRNLCRRVHQSLVQATSPPASSDATQMAANEAFDGKHSGDESASEMISPAERFIETLSLRSSAKVASLLEDRLTDLLERFADASARIAQAIQKLNEDESVSGDSRETMDSQLKHQLPGLLDQLHARSVGAHLLRVVQSPRGANTDGMIDDLVSLSLSILRGKIRESDSGSNAAAGSDLDSRSGSLPEAAGSGSATDSDRLSPGPQSCESGGSDSSSLRHTHSWSNDRTVSALTVDAALDAAKPPLLSCGGQQRLFLLCHDPAERGKFEEQLQQHDGPEVTTITSRAVQAMLINEGQGVELKRVTDWLRSLTGDNGQISTRLESRCDLGITR